MLLFFFFLSFPRNIHYSIHNQRAQEFNAVINRNTRIQPNVYRWYEIASRELQDSRKRTIICDRHGTPWWRLQRSWLHRLVSPKCGSAHSFTVIQIALANDRRLWYCLCGRTFISLFTTKQCDFRRNAKRAYSHGLSISNYNIMLSFKLIFHSLLCCSALHFLIKLAKRAELMKTKAWSCFENLLNLRCLLCDHLP